MTAAADDAVTAAGAAGRRVAAALPPVTDPATLARLRGLLLPGSRAVRTRNGVGTGTDAAASPDRPKNGKARGDHTAR
jgi:hypothetical protein